MAIFDSMLNYQRVTRKMGPKSIATSAGKDLCQLEWGIRDPESIVCCQSQQEHVHFPRWIYGTRVSGSSGSVIRILKGVSLNVQLV